jgi:hypothetical protein
MTAINILWLKIPWERARALRLLNLLTSRDLDDVAQAESAAEEGRPITVSPGRDFFYSYYWMKESPYALRGEIVIPQLIEFARQSKAVIWRFADMENRRRAAPIVLALQAWKLEHGAYPKTLNDLVGPYLKHLPDDPYSGESYRYFPDGLNLWLRDDASDENFKFKLMSPEQGRPLIWSTSPNIKINKSSDNQTNYRIYDYYPTPGKPDSYYWRWWRSDYDLYSHGHFFLVP